MNFKSCTVIFNSSQRIILRSKSSFVPKHAPVQSSDVKTLERFIQEHKKILVLTGIGNHELMIYLFKLVCII